MLTKFVVRKIDFTSAIRKAIEPAINIAIFLRSLIICAPIAASFFSHSFIFAGIAALRSASMREHIDLRVRMSKISLWFVSKIAGVTWEVIGTIPKEPCVLMATHQSTLDCLLLTVLCPNTVFVSKDTLRIPFGFFKGNIYVNRKSSASLISLMRSTKECVANGHNVLVFPEGTRKPHQSPISVMPGMSCLYSQNITKKIVPVYIETGHISPKKSDLMIRHGKVVVEFLPAIEVNPEEMSAREFTKHLEYVLDEARIKHSKVGQL